MDYLVTVVLTILIFGILVFVHELGHFLAALRAGVYVEEFAFGFGPKLLSKKYKNVTYRINLIPLGGYVKMLGDMDGSSFKRYDSKPLTKAEKTTVDNILKKQGLNKKDSDYRQLVNFIENENNKLSEEELRLLEKYLVDEFIPNHPQNFDNKGFLPRLVILLAGVFMNFVLGSLLFYVMFSFTNFTVDMTKIGEPRFFGAQTSNPPVIFQVYREEYRDYEGSLVISYDNENITSMERFDDLLAQNYNQSAPIEIQNANGTIQTEMILTGDGLFTNFDSEVRDRVLLLNVAEDSAAEKAGLQSGSVVLAFDGIDLESPEQLRGLLAENRGKTVEFLYIDLDGNTKTTLVDLPNSQDDEPILGAVPVPNSAYYQNALRVYYGNNKWASGFLHSTNLLLYNASAFGKFIGEAFQQKSVDPIFSQVNSIVAVVDITFTFVKGDNFISILNLVAMLNVILAFMNVLPIPLFDGGHVLFLFIEKIRGKKISTSTQNRIGQIFFVLLIILTLLIVFKDIVQFEWPRRIGDKVLGVIK